MTSEERKDRGNLHRFRHAFWLHLLVLSTTFSHAKEEEEEEKEEGEEVEGASFTVHNTCHTIYVCICYGQLMCWDHLLDRRMEAIFFVYLTFVHPPTSLLKMYGIAQYQRVR